MGESNDSFFENVPLKNIDKDIPINVDLSNTPKKSSVSTMRTSTISKTEKYIDKIYDQTVNSELKKEISLKLQHRFPSEKKGNERLKEFIQRLNDQISTFKSEINFVREQLKEKEHVIRILLHMRCKSSEKYGTTSCSNHSSGKSSDRSSSNNNNVNNNISRNKINANTSNNNNKIHNNNNDNIGNIINNNNNNNINNNISNDNINDNISNIKISNNNIVNSNICNNNINNNNNNNNNNNIAIKLKRNCDVSISGITARNDQCQKKVADINRELKEKCREKKLQFLEHGNTIRVRQLNASNFHLNKRGTQVLSNVFAEVLIQPSFTCSKLKTETLKQGVKYVQS